VDILYFFVFATYSKDKLFQRRVCTARMWRAGWVPNKRVFENQICFTRYVYAYIARVYNTRVCSGTIRRNWRNWRTRRRVGRESAAVDETPDDVLVRGKRTLTARVFPSDVRRRSVAEETSRNRLLKRAVPVPYRRPSPRLDAVYDENEQKKKNVRVRSYSDNAPRRLGDISISEGKKRVRPTFAVYFP